jgi:hypothetical protein
MSVVAVVHVTFPDEATHRLLCASAGRDDLIAWARGVPRPLSRTGQALRRAGRPGGWRVVVEVSDSGSGPGEGLMGQPVGTAMDLPQPNSPDPPAAGTAGQEEIP